MATIVVALVAAKILAGFGSDWRPSHFDEWRTIALAQHALESGSLAREEPVGSINGLAQDISDRNRYLGFVAIVSAWIASVPEPVARFKGLALGFLLVYIAGIYVLCRALGVRPWATVPAILALGTIPTDSMLLGPALVVPISLSMGLLCLAMAAHIRLTRDPPQNSWGGWIGLMGTCGALAFIYPLTLIIFGGLALVDCLARPKIFRTHYGKVMGVLASFGLIVSLGAEWRGDFAATGHHLADLFVVDQRWHLANLIIYPMGYLITPPVLLLALVGAGLSLRHRGRMWVAASFLGPLLALGGYHFLGAGIVVPYQRVGLFLALGATLCLGVAVEQGLVAMESRRLSTRMVVASIAALSGLIVLMPRPSPPFKLTTRSERPSPALEEIARRIAREHSPPTEFYAHPRESMFLEALTGLRAFPASLDSLLTGAPPPALDCNRGWEIVVGPCPCPAYTLAYSVGGIPVFVHRPLTRLD